MRKHEVTHPLHTQALLESLLYAPLLVGDLECSASFDRSLLRSKKTQSFSLQGIELNYRQKLGHLYEDALSFLLENTDQPLDVLGISVQIFNDNKITQGELDYLLKVHDTFTHLELAVKFYLIHEQDGVISFPGPDPRDNWDSKLNRLETHQLRMASSEWGSRCLQDTYGIQKVDVRHLIYGKIFDHMSQISSREAKVLPRSVLLDTETHPWMRVSEWDQYIDSQLACFVPKHLWPVDASQFNAALLETLPVIQKDALVSSIAEYHSCHMIWSDQHQMLIFVVPDHWPDHF